MKHFGDITKLSGYELPVVDVITGGSPCQDLSVAGKRAGLAGERSGLFMEQMRIVKEMRELDRNSGRTGWAVRPRYMVWENVPGAFSSGNPKGSDFAAVLEEIVKAAEPGASVHVCVPDRGWTKSGCYYSEDGSWSIAWRVHDAQFWGVPQRRKRIALVADFGGLSAPEILFERKGLSGDLEPCGAAREETAGAAGGGVESASVGVDTYNHALTGEIACTLSAVGAGDPTKSGPSVLQSAVPTVYGISAYESNAMKSSNPHSGVYEADTARTLDLNGGSPACNQGGMAVVQSAVYDARGNGEGEPTLFEPRSQDGVPRIHGGISPTLNTAQGGQRQPCVCVGNGQLNQMSMAEQANTLDTMHDQQAVMTAAVVRRLTPLECERLQGFPDGWTDIGEWIDSKGKRHKEADSPRYKALGNSIALPFWQWMARRICAQYERTVTMASLFDGIGGFPLVFERCGAKAVWASEIEEFPIAVTKKHFPEEETE